MLSFQSIALMIDAKYKLPDDYDDADSIKMTLDKV